VTAIRVPSHRPEDATSLHDFQLRLPTFEGPLDVLLNLIERDRLPIAEVSLVAVTDGFLAYVAALGSAPPTLLAEFVAVAGRLLLLKSRALLPRPEAAVEETEPVDLVRQLAEYQQVREVASELGRRDRGGLGAFPRGDGVLTPEPRPPQLAPHAPDWLGRALRRRLRTVPAAPAVVTPPPTVSIREMVGRCLAALRRERVVRFAALAAPHDERQERLVAFLAVLLLMRRQVVRVHQADLFGDITLERTTADAAGLPDAADLEAWREGSA